MKGKKISHGEDRGSSEGGGTTDLSRPVRRGRRGPRRPQGLPQRPSTPLLRQTSLEEAPSPRGFNRLDMRALAMKVP